MFNRRTATRAPAVRSGPPTMRDSALEQQQQQQQQGQQRSTAPAVAPVSINRYGIKTRAPQSSGGETQQVAPAVKSRAPQAHGLLYVESPPPTIKSRAPQQASVDSGAFPVVKSRAPAQQQQQQATTQSRGSVSATGTPSSGVGNPFSAPRTVQQQSIPASVLAATAKLAVTALSPPRQQSQQQQKYAAPTAAVVDADEVCIPVYGEVVATNYTVTGDKHIDAGTILKFYGPRVRHMGHVCLRYIEINSDDGSQSVFYFPIESRKGERLVSNFSDTAPVAEFSEGSEEYEGEEDLNEYELPAEGALGFFNPESYDEGNQEEQLEDGEVENDETSEASS